MTTTNKSVRTKAQEFEGLISEVEHGEFAQEHHALIARALRRDEAIENHSELPALIAEELAKFTFAFSPLHVREIVEAVFAGVRKAMP